MKPKFENRKMSVLATESALELGEQGSVTGLLSLRISKGQMERDSVQLALAGELDLLADKLESRVLASKSSSLGWLFSRRQKPEPIQGMYIFGAVGRGKSMLMDLFFQSVSIKNKRRVHFHDFMGDAQERIHKQRLEYKAGRSKEEDPIPPVARQLASEAALLCFDEFSVTDIADAMILGRLFSEIFKSGSVVVATSNVGPDDLYKDGLNRKLFLPFVDILKANCCVHRLDARTDYRLEKLTRKEVYISPLCVESDEKVEEIWQAMIGGEEPVTSQLTIKGRKLQIHQCGGGAARFGFDELCVAALGAQDYLAIARNFHTVFLENVPVMDISRRNHAKRFINLIDTLYDNGRRLVISADAAPDDLYTADSGTEAFEFKRTVSRLHEMQSEEYIAAAE